MTKKNTSAQVNSQDLSGMTAQAIALINSEANSKEVEARREQKRQAGLARAAQTRQEQQEAAKAHKALKNQKAAAEKAEKLAKEIAISKAKSAEQNQVLADEQALKFKEALCKKYRQNRSSKNIIKAFRQMIQVKRLKNTEIKAADTIRSAWIRKQDNMYKKIVEKSVDSNASSVSDDHEVQSFDLRPLVTVKAKSFDLASGEPIKNFRENNVRSPISVISPVSGIPTGQSYSLFGGDRALCDRLAKFEIGLSAVCACLTLHGQSDATLSITNCSDYQVFLNHLTAAAQQLPTESREAPSQATMDHLNTLYVHYNCTKSEALQTLMRSIISRPYISRPWMQYTYQKAKGGGSGSTLQKLESISVSDFHDKMVQKITSNVTESSQLSIRSPF